MHKLVFCFLLLLVLASCSKKAPAPAPTPTNYEVQARVTGSDLTGMGAYVKSSFKIDYRSQFPYESTSVDAPITTPSYSQLFNMGVREKGDFVAAEIGFRGVDTRNSVRPRQTTNLKLEILANGRVVRQTELNSSLTGTNVRFDPYYLKANLICKLDSI